jgi:hypothetical protein
MSTTYAARAGRQTVKRGRFPDYGTYREVRDGVIEPIAATSEQEARDHLGVMVNAALRTPRTQRHYLDVGILREDGTLDVIEGTITQGREELPPVHGPQPLAIADAPFVSTFWNATGTGGPERHSHATYEAAETYTRQHRPWNNTAYLIEGRDPSGSLRTVLDRR